jgi:DNA helicase-2/ATP-dependent DNA helicase PcrA
VSLFLPRVAAAGIALGNAAVLSPWFWPLFQLGRSLRRAGVAIVGPGARPYKRRHLVGPFLECVAAAVADPVLVSRARLSRELAELVATVHGREEPELYGRNGRVAIERILRVARACARDDATAVKWLPAAASATSESLLAGGVGSAQLRAVLDGSARDIVAEIEQEASHRAGEDPRQFTVTELAEFAAPTRHLRLSTVHKAKGREYDAVCVIDVHEGRFPHFADPSHEGIEDGRRLLYVAITRARKLVMLLTQRGARDAPSRFISQMRWAAGGHDHPQMGR